MLCAIDVGHIGKPQSIKDKGAIFNNVHEAELILLYAVLTRGMLELKGVNTVLLTHQTYIQRQNFCTQIKADLHLQCHLNAQKGKYGLILYRETNVTNCMPLAVRIAAHFQEALPITECKVEGMKKDDPRVGCVMDTIPSLLLEPMFLDNPEHYIFLRSEEGLFEIADSITKAILEWGTR